MFFYEKKIVNSFLCVRIFADYFFQRWIVETILTVNLQKNKQ